MTQSISSGCAGLTCPTNSVTPDAATNRISGDCYDSNGNLLAESAPPCPSPTFVYDAENRLTSYSTAAAYSYDGDGLRIKKCIPNCSSPTSSTIYIFSGAKVIAEYDNGAAPGSPSREYVYSGDSLVAKIEGGATAYYHQDHLSNRQISDSGGNSVGKRAHFPYGETWFETGTTTKLKFTSYERDQETAVGANDGNDYAKARNYVNRLGRFDRPDAVAGSTGVPQTLNGYAYAHNDPINASDPSGNFVLAFIAELGDPAGFGRGPFSLSNEFDMLQIQIGTAPLYHSASENFRFEDYSSDELRSLADQGEIEYLGRVPVYGSFFVQSGQATGSGQCPDSAKHDKLVSSTKVLDMFYCLWKKGGYGNARTERSMWVTEKSGSFDSVQWPWSAESGKETWKGPRPGGSIAIAHTHPNAMSPKPSSSGDPNDQKTSNIQGLPVYVVTRDALWKAVPNQKQPEQVAGRDWWKDSEQREKRKELTCP